VEWGDVLRQNPRARALPFVGRVTVVLATAASPVANTEESLDATLKLPPHVRAITAEVPTARAMLGLPPVVNETRRLAKPTAPRQIPAGAGPGT
jgi:hypothetical protein